MKKSKPEIEWALITLTAGSLIAALLVSCAPTHRSFSLSDLQAPSNPVAPTSDNNDVPNPQASTSRSSSGSPAAIVGDWICEDSDSGCTVSKISLRADGSALADGMLASLTVKPKSQNAVHVILVVPAHDGISGTTLDGDIGTVGEVNQISLSGDLYSRSSD